MAIAYHVSFGAYGFWLPNDPRGSWSEYVASWELFPYGPATTTNERQSVAYVPHDRASRRAAKAALKFPPVLLTGRQALAIAHGFRRATKEGAYRIYACAILPDHVHLVIAMHERPITQIVGHLKSRATHRIVHDGLWYEDHRPVWASGSWRVFLDSVEDVRRSIDYVEKNPIKEGKRKQTWSFVVPFEC